MPLVKTPRPELAFFTAHGSAVYDLGISDDRGRSKRLTGESSTGGINPALFTSVSWSPDGRRLAFAGGPGSQSGGLTDRTNIYTIDAGGSNARRITNVGDAAIPVLSPDGRTIAFTRLSHAGRRFSGSLWSVGTDGSAPTQIAAAANLEILTAGSFSPDGARLAFTRATLKPQSLEIDVMNADGSGEPTKLIDQARDPAYSPDGSQIAYSSSADHNGRLCYGDRCFFGGELYVARPDGSGAKRLTRTNALDEAHPSWLPSGARIAYQRGVVFQNAEAMSIFEVNSDGTCAHTILKGIGRGPWYSDPAWRPSRPRTGDGRLSC